jgi:hypothetical protein
VKIFTDVSFTDSGKSYALDTVVTACPDAVNNIGKLYFKYACDSMPQKAFMHCKFHL